MAFQDESRNWTPVNIISWRYSLNSWICLFSWGKNKISKEEAWNIPRGVLVLVKRKKELLTPDGVAELTSQKRRRRYGGGMGQNACLHLGWYEKAWLTELIQHLHVLFLPLSKPHSWWTGAWVWEVCVLGLYEFEREKLRPMKMLAYLWVPHQTNRLEHCQ